MSGSKWGVRDITVVLWLRYGIKAKADSLDQYGPLRCHSQSVSFPSPSHRLVATNSHWNCRALHKDQGFHIACGV